MITAPTQPSFPQSVIVDFLIHAFRGAKANDDLFLCYLIEMALADAAKESPMGEALARSAA